MKKNLPALLALSSITIFSNLFATPTIDGDSSDGDYTVIASYTSGRDGFGSGNNIDEINYFADLTHMYIGIPCDLGSNDNIVLFFDFSGYDGNDSGNPVGESGASGVFGGSGFTNTSGSGCRMDFEVDYAFAFNEGNGTTQFFVDAARFGTGGSGDPIIDSGFLNNGSGLSCNQSGTASNIPNTTTSGISANGIQIAYNNGGGADQGIEVRFDYDAMPGIDNSQTVNMFVLITNSTGFSSNETIPGDPGGSNLGDDADFSSNPNSGGPFHTTGDHSLPVELSSFTARQQGNNVRLDWRTETEHNNAGFRIYRRKFEAKAYEMIADFRTDKTLKGQGSTPFGNDYFFYDNQGLASHTNYSYIVADVDFNGKETKHKDKPATIFIVFSPLPKDFTLLGNFPNPFNPETTIEFSVPEQAKFSIEIFNVLGQSVKVLAENEIAKEGSNQISWNGTDENNSLVPSGVYFYKITTGNETQVSKMLLLK